MAAKIVGVTPAELTQISTADFKAAIFGRQPMEIRSCSRLNEDHKSKTPPKGGAR